MPPNALPIAAKPSPITTKAAPTAKRPSDPWRKAGAERARALEKIVIPGTEAGAAVANIPKKAVNNPTIFGTKTSVPNIAAIVGIKYPFVVALKSNTL